MKKRPLQNSYGITTGPCSAEHAAPGNLRNSWAVLQNRIEVRLNEFRRLWTRGSEEQVFAELTFCLLTPQSKARNCWAAVQRLHAKGLLLSGNAPRIARELSGVRFHHTKARRIVLVRRQFMRDDVLHIKKTLASFPGARETREWLVRHVNGLGYKEASHFLRNIGLYEDIAILDRHILRNLQSLGVISIVPDCLTPRRYLEIERQLQSFAKKIAIPASHLDLLLWCKETGEIFK